MSEFNSGKEVIEAVYKKREERRRKKRKKKIYNIIIIALCIVLVVCLVNIGSYLWQDFSNDNFNGDLAGEFISYGDASSSDGTSSDEDSSSNGGGGSGTKKEIVVPESIDFVALKEKYKDAVGWIFSKNGVINYPVVQGSDNSYYLNRLPSGKKNINGSIFMDYRSKSDFSGANTIIYGHSMDNGSMFRTLLNYKKQSYYDKYPEMYIFTPEGKYRLVIFAAYETKSDDMAYGKIYGESGFTKYVSHALSKSKIKTDVEVEVGDRLVTLSTCAYSSNDARFIVVGKLVKDGETADSTTSSKPGSGYYGSITN